MCELVAEPYSQGTCCAYAKAARTAMVVYHAGRASAADPRYTSVPQRERAAERGQPAVTS